MGRVDDIIFFLSEKVRNKVAEEQKIRMTANLKNQINTR